MKGPRLTDQEFFQILDHRNCGLQETLEAFEKGALTEAKREFVKHLKTQDRPIWFFDWRDRLKPVGAQSVKVDLTAADKILRRELTSVGVSHKFTDEIDWQINPIDYMEWPWQLSRHHFWVTLGEAYWATGDEKYAKEFVFQMNSWVSKELVPLYDDGNRSKCWRTIEAGIRSGQTWFPAFFRFLSSPSFTDEDIVTMVKSFIEHARHLMRWPQSGNWLTMEASGLLHVGVMFPQFKEARGWRDTAIARLYTELDRQVYPDGTQIELTTGYHQVSLHNFLLAYRIAKLNGIWLPTDYLVQIEKMYDFNLYASMPNGELPGLNDGSQFSIRNSMAGGFDLFPQRRDYEWVANAGTKGEKPRFNSYGFPYAGYYIMRSGWNPDDKYLLFDAGPFGYGHQHEDKLSFVLYAYGKVHIIDPGNYHYIYPQRDRTNPNWKWRLYVISGYAHNTILVDGQDQHRRGRPRETYVASAPLPNKWVTDPRFDYAVGVYDEGYGSKNDISVNHTRRIFFVKPDYWIITDQLKTLDENRHRYDSLFHLNAPSASINETTNMILTQDSEGSNLAIIPPTGDRLTVQIVSGQEEPVVQGWIPAGGYDVKPIPTAILTNEGTGQIQLLYVLYPIPKGGRCPIKSVERVEIYGKTEGVQGVQITFDDGIIHYFVQAESKGRQLNFAEYSTRGEATFLEVKPDGKVSRRIVVDDIT
ncbi:MAG: alginate lyase family protein [Candidatus Bathyarchaeia archaeon]